MTIAAPESELSVIGAAMYAPEACDDAFDRLKPEHFHDPMNARLWSALTRLRTAGGSLAPHSLRDAMGEDEAFVTWGGIAALVHLFDAASPVTLPHEIAAISDRSVRRQIEGLCRDTIAMAQDLTSGDGDALLIALEKGAGEIARQSVNADEWIPAGELIRQAIESARGRQGRVEFVTGLREVDQLVGGFGRGELSLIAGRPGMAKSLVASQIAKANAAAGKGVAFFSKEMSVEPLGLRLACDLAYDPDEPMFSAAPDSGNPTYDDARKFRLGKAQWQRLEEAGRTVATWPLMFDVRPGLTLSTIESCARRQFRQWEKRGVEPGPVIIDHLGIIKPETPRNGNKVAETADISRGLAAMAKRLDVPVIALCQLNRAVEGRGEDKRPGLSDLRWAGELEQDARLVIFPYRPEYYHRPPEDAASEDAAARAERETKLRRMRNKLFWIVAKNNNGPPGQVETFCDVSRAAIRDRRT